VDEIPPVSAGGAWGSTACAVAGEGAAYSVPFSIGEPGERAKRASPVAGRERALLGCGLHRAKRERRVTDTRLETDGRGESTGDAKVLLGLALLVLAYAVFVLFSSVVDLTFRTTDDSYYYFLTASNLAAGKGPTFDGLHPTNGFHPLWMLMLVPVYALFGDDPIRALRVVLLLLGVLGAGTVWIAYRVLRTAGTRLAAFALMPVFLSPILVNPMLNGLETGVLLFLQFVLLAVCVGPNPLLRVGDAARFAFVLSLVFLARLDSVFLGAGLGGVLVWDALRRGAARHERSRLLRTGLVVLAVGLVLVGPYLLWNHGSFGHWTPISGDLKSSFPVVTGYLRKLASPHRLFGILLLAVGGVSLVASFAFGFRRLTNAAPFRRALLGLWIGALFHFAYSALYMSWGVHWWHFASYLPVALGAALLVIAEGLAAVRRPVVWAGGIAAVLTVGSLAALLADATVRGEEHATWYGAAVWADENLPADAVVGMTDCGIFGYFSRRTTVNLDGVINGYAYQDALAEGELSEFLREARVTHIADHLASYRDGRRFIDLPARLHRKPGAALVATPDAEVFRSHPYREFRGNPVFFSIWDFARVDVLDLGRGEESAAAVRGRTSSVRIPRSLSAPLRNAGGFNSYGLGFVSENRGIFRTVP
jgi:hypothetical protein